MLKKNFFSILKLFIQKKNKANNAYITEKLLV